LDFHKWPHETIVRPFIFATVAPPEKFANLWACHKNFIFLTNFFCPENLHDHFLQVLISCILKFQYCTTTLFIISPRRRWNVPWFEYFILALYSGDNCSNAVTILRFA